MYGLLVFEEDFISDMLNQYLCRLKSSELQQAYFLCEIESPSMLTSNLCAGSIGRLVFGSIGRFRLEYSASWTAFTTSNFSLRCFFSLQTLSA